MRRLLTSLENYCTIRSNVIADSQTMAAIQACKFFISLTVSLIFVHMLGSDEFLGGTGDTMNNMVNSGVSSLLGTSTQVGGRWMTFSRG